MEERTIVCGVEDSPGAREALEVAIDLARRLELPLVLAHAATPDAPEGVPEEAGSVAVPSVDDEERARIESGGTSFLERLAQSYGLTDVELVCRYGKPESVLRELAAAPGVVMLVIGSRGHGPIRALAEGSLVPHLLPRGGCPILVVPPRRPERDPTPGTILCGIDGSEGALRALRAAEALAEKLDGELVLAHVAPIPMAPGISLVRGAAEELRRVDQERAEELLRATAEEVEAPLAVRRRVSFGRPGEGLADLADEERAELVAVGARGRNPFAAAMLGSVSLELLGASRAPVLVVPPAADLEDLEEA